MLSFSAVAGPNGSGKSNLDGGEAIGYFWCFSAVVGPNGSGKSNVIDAMLFVFGKRAKQMRLNKVSELIHNSTNHQNLDSAGVSVQFEEIIDLLEVVAREGAELEAVEAGAEIVDFGGFGRECGAECGDCVGDPVVIGSFSASGSTGAPGVPPVAEVQQRAAGLFSRRLWVWGAALFGYDGAHAEDWYAVL
ncbi:unnamed protein product [Microthlaspi erraticum]|uniref:RecF/RecN/SMC N-terminal domain-containing protein n=1 Tax=Microthlaspi erraticum TaxID=1685480 RepID=A0A6D2KS04_9BRAS|nr:unnamed protein product [Microthlaspi erraticum]